MPAPTICLECNAPLSPSDTGGVCPKCLLKLGLASQLAAGTLPATAQGLRPDGAIEEPFTFGGYRILRLLGKGGMGAVYEAEQIESGRRVALKVLGQSLDTPEMRQRFVREGQLAASVRHQNVVTVLAAEEIESIPVISMELLRDGTLKDRVSRRGPLAPEEAVDVALQIVAGLEAAHASGVLHRDVKPANCFGGANGTVKVGDFGLSISTLAKAEQSLTQSGTVLGTPAYAAPEQLRGEEIDARADIYAVGATLYFLLTGKPVFEEESLVALIASVLQKEPVEVGQRRRGIPSGLSAIVMRCLAKDRDRRFRDYASLRAALSPYSSRASTPATLGLRFAAGLVDIVGTCVPAFVGLAIWSDTPDMQWVGDRSAGMIFAFILTVAWGIGWFAVPEGLWGRSLGKALCGLRVIRVNGQPILFGRALARALIFQANAILTPLITALVVSAERYRQSVEAAEWLPTHWLWLVLFVPLFFTMRRRNGYATVHDLWTGTRVVEEETVARAIAKAEPVIAAGALASGERVGPYTVLERKGNLAEAVDPLLRRKVWIQFAEEGAPAIGRPRREIARPTRLLWLQGRRGAAENWDAYECPLGMSLLERRGSEEPWERARVWLSDLADELHASLADNTIPDSISLAQVWITSSGHAVLLDFPAPEYATEPPRPVVTAEHVQDFLLEAAELAASPRMPAHARAFLGALREHRFEAAPIVAGNLRALLNRMASVSPRRRALSAWMTPLLLVTFFSLIAMILFQARAAFDDKWASEHPAVPSPRFTLEVMSELPDDAAQQRPLLARSLARSHGPVIIGDAFWNSAEMRALIDLDLIVRYACEYYVAADLAHVEREPVPSASEVEGAEKLEVLLRRQAVRLSPAYFILAYGVYAIAGACLLGVAIGLLFRGSPMLRMFGFAVTRWDGAPAERWRMAARSLLAGAPAFMAVGFVEILEPYFWLPDRSFPWLALGVVIGVSLGWMAGLVTRGPAEKLTGTWIVPL